MTRTPGTDPNRRTSLRVKPALMGTSSSYRVRLREHFSRPLGITEPRRSRSSALVEMFQVSDVVMLVGLKNSGQLDLAGYGATPILYMGPAWV